jgi:hypothetical protein
MVRAWSLSDRLGSVAQLVRAGALPPGKYYVLAGDVANDNTPDRIAKLRGARNKAKEVEAPPGGTVQVTVEAGDL